MTKYYFVTLPMRMDHCMNLDMEKHIHRNNYLLGKKFFAFQFVSSTHTSLFHVFGILEHIFPKPKKYSQAMEVRTTTLLEMYRNQCYVQFFLPVYENQATEVKDSPCFRITQT